MISMVWRTRNRENTLITYKVSVNMYDIKAHIVAAVHMEVAMPKLEGSLLQTQFDGLGGAKRLLFSKDPSAKSLGLLLLTNMVTSKSAPSRNHSLR